MNLEADIYGLDLPAKAGFDPRESAYWINMGKAGGETPLEFMSTHPAHETRISDLQKHMPAALKLRAEAQAKGKTAVKIRHVIPLRRMMIWTLFSLLTVSDNAPDIRKERVESEMNNSVIGSDIGKKYLSHAQFNR